MEKVVDLIKKKIDCLTIAQENGLEIKNNRSKSFIHEGSNETSVQFYPDTDTWFSWSDNVGGDCINLLAYLKYSGENHKAIEDLATRFGIAYRNDYNSQINNLVSSIEFWHNSLREKDLDYLYSRKITDNTIEEYQIGWSEDLQRLIIPVFKNKQPVSWCGRTYDTENNSKYQKSKCNTEDTQFRVDDTLYGLETLNRDNDTLIIAEGVFDFLSLYQEGFSVLANATGLSKENRKLICDYATHFKKTILCFDNDNAGKGFMGRVAEMLFNKQIDFYIMILPSMYAGTPTKDISDLYTLGCDLHSIFRDDSLINGTQYILENNYGGDYSKVHEYIDSNGPYLTHNIKKTIKGYIRQKFEKEDYDALLKALNRNKTDRELVSELVKFYNNSIIYSKDVETLYRYNGKYWEEIRDEQLLSDMSKTNILKKLSATHMKSLLSIFKGDISKEFIPNSKNCLNLKNGTLYITNKKNGYYYFRDSHNPADDCTYILNYDYNPDAKSKLFDKFMNDITLGDELVQRRFGEYVGSLFYNKTIEQKGMLFYGNGSNGKTAFINVIRNLLGNDALCSNTNLDVIGSRFQANSLIGKWVNFCQEASTRKSSSEDVVKAILSNSTISTDVKSKNRISFTPRAKIIVDCNTMPRATEMNGWERRWQGTVHTFKAKFCMTQNEADHEKNGKLIDPTLEDKLAKPESLSAVLNWALEGYVRIVDNGYRYSYCPADKEAEKEFIEATEPLIDFVEWFDWKCHGGAIGKGSTYQKITSSQLYQEYLYWADVVENLQRDAVLNLTTFTKRVKKYMLASEVGEGKKVEVYYPHRVLTYRVVSDKAN